MLIGNSHLKNLKYPVLVIMGHLFEIPEDHKIKLMPPELVRHAPQHLINYVTLPVVCPVPYASAR